MPYSQLLHYQQVFNKCLGLEGLHPWFHMIEIKILLTAISLFRESMWFLNI